jgi:hypothetical protein
MGRRIAKSRRIVPPEDGAELLEEADLADRTGIPEAVEDDDLVGAHR